MAYDSRVRFFDRTTPPHVLTLVIISGAAALPMNMFLPSMPSMAAYYGVEYAVIQLSVALFLAGNAVMQLIVGPMSDRFGRRRVLIGGFVIFVLASLGCVLAKTVEVFLFFRVLQAGSVVGIALSRAVIRDLYDQAQSASLIGYVTMGMAIIPMLAPMFGGLLEEAFGWRSVFWTFVLLGLATVWLIFSDLGETNSNQSASFAAQFREYPELLRSPRFWGYALSAAFNSGVFFSYLGGAPFIGTDIFGLTPQALGLYIGAPALGYAFGNFMTGRYAARVGLNKMILIGTCICATGMILSLITFLAGFGSALTFFGFMIFVGIGNGFVMANAIAGSLSVRPKLAGTASGLGGSLMIGGGAILSALAGFLLNPESGPYPLLYIQIALCLMGILAIWLVIVREHRLAQSDPQRSL